MTDTTLEMTETLEQRVAHSRRRTKTASYCDCWEARRSSWSSGCFPNDMAVMLDGSRAQEILRRFSRLGPRDHNRAFIHSIFEVKAPFLKVKSRVVTTT